MNDVIIEFAVRHDAGRFYVEVFQDRELKKTAGPVDTLEEADQLIEQYRDMAAKLGGRELPLATQ